jgi:choline kinase
MRVPTSVVINCAGMGNRLKLGCTKALVEVGGLPLIQWHLKMIPRHINVVCGVGFQAEEVMKAALEVRKDLTFAFNRDYQSNGPAATLAKGAHGIRGDVVSLDGDLLGHPVDFHKFMDLPYTAIGVCDVTTTEPVYAEVDATDPDRLIAKSFSRTPLPIGQMEWTGLVKLPAETLREAADEGRANNYVFEMVAPLLPLKALPVRCSEIDTPEDLVAAERWLMPIKELWDHVHDGL